MKKENNIQKLRIRKQWTQEQVAKKWEYSGLLSADGKLGQHFQGLIGSRVWQHY